MNKNHKLILLTLGIIAGVLIVVLPKHFATQENTVIPTSIQVTPSQPEQPTPSPVTTVHSARFDTAVTLSAGETAAFSDGLQVKLKAVNDSRCKSNVQCIWAGELSGDFALSGGSLTSPKSLQLGTLKNTTVTLGSYTFALSSATTKSITFTVAHTKPTASLGPCYIGGCSREVCSDQKDAVSNCIYNEKYACYKTATCERQASGQCGWTLSPALQACLSK